MKTRWCPAETSSRTDTSDARAQSESKACRNPRWNSLEIILELTQVAAVMKISDLLCYPPETEEAARPTTCVQTLIGEFKRVGSSESFKCIESSKKKIKMPHAEKNMVVVPDKKRKRHYYMSAAQKQLRCDNEKYESRVFNLTLDINNLKQEVMRLLEYRDLQFTRLLLNRLRLENELLKTVEVLIRGVRQNTTDPACRFSRAISSQSNSAPAARACGNVYEFTIRLDKSRYSCVVSNMQVLLVEAERETDSAETIEAVQVCGTGGSVVEVLSKFTFPFRRQILTALFPHVAGDEMLLARLIGLRATCPVRLLLYFNAQRQLVRQVAQADLIPALWQARPNEMAVLMDHSSNF